MNRVTEIADARQGITRFDYDQNGNLLTVQDAKAQATSYTYDNMDRLGTRKDALNRQESYQYDPAGNLTQFTDRKAQPATFTYDALNRRTRADYAAGSFTTFTYDAVGRLTRATDSVSGAIDFFYDMLDRLILEVTPLGAVAYEYDPIGRRTQMTVAGQAPVTYQYDTASRLTQVAQGSLVVGLGYDDANRRTSLTYPNGTSTSYTYDNASRLTTMTHNGPGGVIENLTYTYDAAGNRTSLTRANGTASLLPTAVASASYDATNQQTAFAGATHTFDANGNLTHDGTNTYVWDARNRLTGISGSVTANFSYDPLGRRGSKTIGGAPTQFVYDGNDVMQDINSGAVAANYLRSLNIDEPFIRKTSSGNEHYHVDALGSSLALSDASGALATTYAYEPFGKTTVTGTSPNAFQYTGRENDGTGLTYYRARYYSPRMGRFMSEDPIGFLGGDVNLYTYVGNNPTNGIDAFGQCKIEVKFNPLGLGNHHAHIVTTDPDGSQTGFRGGPQSGVGSSGLSSASGGSSSQKSPGRGGSSNSGNSSSPGSGPGGPGGNTGPFGPLTPTTGPYDPNFIDYPRSGGPLPSMTVLDNSESCSSYNNQFSRQLQAIQQANIPYNPLSTNSNALVNNTLTNSGLNPGQPPVRAPGWNTPLRY